MSESKEVILIKRDKFSFQVFDYKVIENIDFSFNHMELYRVISRTKLPFEVCISIKNIGLLREVKISANVTFYNNTSYTFGLMVMKNKDFIENYSNPSQEKKEGKS